MSLSKDGKTLLIRLSAVIIFITVVVVILLATQPGQSSAIKEPALQAVESHVVNRQDIRPFERVVGRLEPARKTALHFEVGGVLASRQVVPGQKVESGDLLLILDKADLQNRLTEAQASLQQERATGKRDRQLLDLSRGNASLAADEVRRLENLGKKSMSSQSALDSSRQRLSTLKAEVANLEYATNTVEQRLSIRQAQAEIAQRNLDRSRLLAPYAGRVNAIYAEAGDRLTPADKVIDFIDDSQFEIRLHVSRQAVTELTENMPVAVSIDGLEYAGKVIEFERDPDPQTYTYEARILLEAGGLLSGTLAAVRLPLRPSIAAVVVPVSAVLLDDGLTSVFVIKDTVLEKRPVKTAVRFDQWQVIIDGLQSGEQIVARDVAALADKQVVTVQ